PRVVRGASPTSGKSRKRKGLRDEHRVLPLDNLAGRVLGPCADRSLSGGVMSPQSRAPQGRRAETPQNPVISTRSGQTLGGNSPPWHPQPCSETRAEPAHTPGPKPWNAGTGQGWVDRRGYRWIRVNGRSVREHRHVMEQSLGRKLTMAEVVHHKNGDTAD